MAPDIEEVIREALTSALRDEHGNSSEASEKSASNGGMSGIKGLAAGMGAAALAPVAVKTAGKLARGLGVDSLGDLAKSPGETIEGAKSKLGDRLTSSVKDKAKDAVDDAGGPGGIVKDAAKQMLPFGGGDDGRGGKGGAEGAGKGRRMPVQQSVDIGIPIEAVYNQFTQFEDWPQFMHRVKRVTQDDDCTVSFAVKIWGKTKEFTAEIDTQRPDQRIKWKTSEGMTHTGVVTFHELGPNLTRIILNLDVDPGSLVEKFARGARHVKRAARAELHRFVGFIEMAENETGAWRGVIEDGELVEEHDPSYDERRQYSDIEELTGQPDSDQDEEQDDRGGDESEDAQESPKARRSQRQQRARGRDQQGRDTGGDDEPSRSSRGRQSSSSGKSSSSGSGKTSSSRSRGSSSGTSGRSQARSRSSRQSKSSAAANSRSSRRSPSSHASSGGPSRSGSRSQNRKS